MSSEDWMKYIGLPYKLGADPENGEASDCIHLVFRVANSRGVKTPDIPRRWYLHLARKEPEPIMNDWFNYTEQTFGPEDCAMTLITPGVNFSIAIVVDGGLLGVRPRVGVTWAPLEHLRPMNYRRFRHE